MPWIDGYSIFTIHKYKQGRRVSWCVFLCQWYVKPFFGQLHKNVIIVVFIYNSYYANLKRFSLLSFPIAPLAQNSKEALITHDKSRTLLWIYNVHAKYCEKYYDFFVFPNYHCEFNENCVYFINNDISYDAIIITPS